MGIIVSCLTKFLSVPAVEDQVPIIRVESEKQHVTVTNIVKQPMQWSIPYMKEHIFPFAIKRPAEFQSLHSSAAFGLFIEYLVLYSVGISQFRHVESYLSKFPNSDLNNLYRSPYKNPVAICRIMLMGKSNPALVKHVATNIKNYENFMNYINRNMPPFQNDQQKTCSLNYQGFHGEIDAIFFDTIIDIKCRSRDNVEEYRKQLFTYYCIHRLQYKTGNIRKCEIWNFLTGRKFTMDVSSITDQECQQYLDHVKASVVPT